MDSNPEPFGLQVNALPTAIILLMYLGFDSHYIYCIIPIAGWYLIVIYGKPDGTLSDHEKNLFMMIYLIEFNQLIKIEISCGSLYQMNQIKINLIVKQQRYTMTGSKIRRVLLPKINQS